MTFSSAFTAAGSAAGFLGTAILVVATVLTTVADLTGRDLGTVDAEADRS